MAEEERYPIMNYMRDLENRVRQLKWQLTCHRLGSFFSGFIVGLILGLGLALFMLRR